MKLALSVIIACTGVAASAAAQSAQQPTRQVAQAEAPLFEEIPGSMEFSGQMIARPVQFDDLADRGLSQAEIDQTLRRVRAELAAFEEVWYEPLVDHHVFRVPAGSSENEVAARLMATGLFEFVEPDWFVYPVNCPNDPRLGNQWHHNTDIMMSCEAWALHTGGPHVTVGICDTGIQTSHPEFQLHRKEGYNAPQRRWESQGGAVGPVHPHGTMVTGCSAANSDNGTGVAGVGWNFSHRMMRVSNSSGGGANMSDLTHAALTSIQAGDNVANVSYSGVTSSAVRTTATQIKNLGGLLVWAAGNDNRNLNWGDRDSDDVIVVGATTGADRKASFSAYGRSVDLVAPGNNVYTTSTNSGYGAVSGTSFAAPLTAGVIAMIWSANPSLTPDEVETILKAGCDDLGADGVDNTYGYGRVNTYNSLVLAGAGGSIDLPFLEEFTSTTFDGDVWASTSGAEINSDGVNPPSDPYAMNLDGTDIVTTKSFLLADEPQPRYVSYFTQHRGVETAKFLFVEYLDENNNWQLLQTFLSDGVDQDTFQFSQHALPAGAYHDFFKLRFSAAGSDSTDNWYIDDIRVGDEFDPPNDCIADFNGDGEVNTQDVLAFLNAWNDGDSSADINGDGEVNTQDVLEFLNLWNIGC
jgi:subtilisin family serine protease